jgi:hypothetical protein
MTYLDGQELARQLVIATDAIRRGMVHAATPLELPSMQGGSGLAAPKPPRQMQDAQPPLPRAVLPAHGLRPLHACCPALAPQLPQPPPARPLPAQPPSHVAVSQRFLSWQEELDSAHGEWLETSPKLSAGQQFPVVKMPAFPEPADDAIESGLLSVVIIPDHFGQFRASGRVPVGKHGLASVIFGSPWRAKHSQAQQDATDLLVGFQHRQVCGCCNALLALSEVTYKNQRPRRNLWGLVPKAAPGSRRMRSRSRSAARILP